MLPMMMSVYKIFILPRERDCLSVLIFFQWNPLRSWYLPPIASKPDSINRRLKKWLLNFKYLQCSFVYSLANGNTLEVFNPFRMNILFVCYNTLSIESCEVVIFALIFYKTDTHFSPIIAWSWSLLKQIL